jgi:hypothetical protein
VFEEMLILSVVEFMDENDVQLLMIFLTAISSAVMFFQ